MPKISLKSQKDVDELKARITELCNDYEGFDTMVIVAKNGAFLVISDEDVYPIPPEPGKEYKMGGAKKIHGCFFPWPFR